MFTFLSGEKVAFFRADAEQAEWSQDEMSLYCTFPLDSGKLIERGMTVLFQDPATDDWKAYEVRNVSQFPGEGYQQFTAEDLAISELTDCHLQDEIELTNATVKTALNKVLTGTGWNIGTNDSDETSTADIGRGSVWEGVTTIRGNWNVNIIPRVTVNASGITGRYLDIVTTEGTYRGLRFSIDKNCSDPCVTIDDSELYTALYAYGASYTEGEDIEHQTTVETTFKDIVWSKTSKHPAKPAGQVYLEWPEKTALYGRNGKARFGYYQNSSIKSAETLLEKTWETLKTVSEPKISITGTVTDLKRLGYHDEPLRLYDLAIIDFGGTPLYKQIIKLTVNLLDPTGDNVTIGDYIPNIIYINRETENYATGGSTGTSGGRGGGGGSRSQKQQGEFETTIAQNERNIVLEARQVNENREKLRAAGIEIDPITGVVIYAEDVENGIGANFRVQSNKIESEVTERKAMGQELSSRITQTSNQITLEVSNRISADNQLSSRIDVTDSKITLEVTNRINADTAMSSRIDVNASNISLETKTRKSEDTKLSGRIDVTATNISLEVTRATTAEGTLSGRIDVNADKVAIVVSDDGHGHYGVKTASIVAGINDQTGSYVKISADTIDLSGYVTVSDLDATNASIDNLVSGTTQAAKLWATVLQATGFAIGSDGRMTYLGHEITSHNAKSRSGQNIAVLGWSQ